MSAVSLGSGSWATYLQVTQPVLSFLDPLRPFLGASTADGGVLVADGTPSLGAGRASANATLVDASCIIKSCRISTQSAAREKCDRQHHPRWGSDQMERRSIVKIGRRSRSGGDLGPRLGSGVRVLVVSHFFQCRVLISVLKQLSRPLFFNPSAHGKLQ